MVLYRTVFTKPYHWILSEDTSQIRAHIRIIYPNDGTRGSAVGWDTMLQAGRSRFPFPMRSLDFSIDLILPTSLWPCGSTRPLPRGKVRPARKADNLTAILWADCLHGLIQGQILFQRCHLIWPSKVVSSLHVFRLEYCFIFALFSNAFSSSHYTELNDWMISE
jgi:hypothetical protein